ncbi:MAG TPA: PAS domain-containing protein, partial [Aquihabitans sp.]|nr:PAS domain-containing protein [Aquihabitans sp.]
MEQGHLGLEGLDAVHLLGHLPDLVVLAEADGTIRWVGPSIPPSLGWLPSDLVGRSMFDLFAKEGNHPLHLAALAGVVGGPGPYGPIEVTVVAEDGRLVELEIMVTNAVEDPAIGLLVGTCRDITNRDSALEGLRQREAWASSLLRGGNDLVIVCDRVGGIAYVSPSAERILGVDCTSLTGRSVADLVHPDDLLSVPGGALPVDRLLGTGPGRRPVLRFACADGSWRRLRVERSSTDQAGERSVLLTARDLTDEDAAADLLSEQTVLLERIARGAPVG